MNSIKQGKKFPIYSKNKRNHLLNNAKIIMPKILLPFLLIVSLSGCYSAQQTANDKEDKSKVVTNIISETKIIGEIEFEDESKGLTILVKPVDARKFGKELQSGNYRDGRHKTVFSSVDKADNDDSSDINFDLLINKLLDEGLSINQAQLIIEAIQDEVQANESLFVYGDTEIYFSNDYMANESNPFTLDGRYLSVIEFEIVNSSDETTKICNNDFVLNSENVSYKSIPTKELLSSIPSTTIQYELLHKLLMGECEIIPPNSTITTHLVYPSFYSEEEVTVHYSSQETSLEDQFVIEHNVVRNEYSFSTIKVG
ncbi:MAG TPA: hypothetical protein DD671_02530, partial [Balneolaceae bacterium]|nr:hypothetical protein [Balneolaceae bacterium]